MSLGFERPALCRACFCSEGRSFTLLKSERKSAGPTNVGRRSDAELRRNVTDCFRSEQPSETTDAGSSRQRIQTDAKSGTAPSRIGLKTINGHFSPELSVDLKVIAACEQRSIQSLIGEALDIILITRGYLARGER